MAKSEHKPPTVDITNCDRELIHIPGAILPHGALLVLEANTLEVLQAAGNTAALLGVAIQELLGRSAATLFRSDQVENLHALAKTYDLAKPRHLLDPLLRVLPDHPLDASLHRSGGSLVLEFETADTADRFAADPLAGVHEMVQGLDAAVTLQALCQFAAERVRSVARYDRVLVYRFMQDDSGWVIAESREEHLEPFLNLHYPAADIPKQARALYVKNWLRLITQVNYDPAPLTPMDNPHTGKPLGSYATCRPSIANTRLSILNGRTDAQSTECLHSIIVGVIKPQQRGERPDIQRFELPQILSDPLTFLTCDNCSSAHAATLLSAAQSLRRYHSTFIFIALRQGFMVYPRLTTQKGCWTRFLSM